MSEDAYAKAGVNQGDADAAVASLVSALAASRPTATRQVLPSGHYANVVRLDDRTGIALSTDGVGTKLVVAERVGRWDHAKLFPVYVEQFHLRGLDRVVGLSVRHLVHRQARDQLVDPDVQLGALNTGHSQ